MGEDIGIGPPAEVEGHPRGQEIETRRTAYSRDSRVEVISRNPDTDWIALEHSLIACLKN